MTKLTTVALLTSLAALTGTAPAWAAGVSVPLAGRSPAQIDRDVTKAAETVCQRAIQMDLTGDYGAQQDCVVATVNATLRHIAAQPADPTLAEAQASPPR